jgi:hypothetical protein
MAELIAKNYQSYFNNSSSFYKYSSKVTPDNFEMIDVKKTKYSKKIFVIYNPNAGKKYDR